ncbi:MAG: peptidylprolyl isomerase [Planctomycetaceae bacterium]|nr:peptidylprolyl isomerase [Planctomycetaceae bacterium]
MTENTPTQPAPPTQNSGGKWKFLVFGTAIILIAGGIGYQVYSARTAGAQTETEQAGTTRMNQNLARVNDQYISYDAVAQESVKRVGGEVLDNLINRMIIQQACQKQGIQVSKGEVTAEIARIAEKFKMPIETWYQMLQTERGLNPDQYQNDIIWPMLALKKLAGDNVQVTQQDMQKAFVRDYGQMVKARMIMLDNFRRAQEAYEQARKNPEAFDELAQEYSIEPNSRSLGGTIPHIRRYSGNETLENAAFKLKPGQVSGILEVDHGRYVILKCEGFTEPVVTDINQVKDDLYEQVKEEKVQQAVAEVFQKLKKEARVDNYLTRTSTRADIQQTSGFQNPENIRPAAATQPQ